MSIIMAVNFHGSLGLLLCLSHCSPSWSYLRYNISKLFCTTCSYIIYLYWFAGGVKAVRIPKEKGTGKSKGFAYVEFKNRISHGVSSDLHIDQSYCCFVQILLVVKSILIVFSQQKFTVDSYKFPKRTVYSYISCVFPFRVWKTCFLSYIWHC